MKTAARLSLPPIPRTKPQNWPPDGRGHIEYCDGIYYAYHPDRKGMYYSVDKRRWLEVAP